MRASHVTTVLLSLTPLASAFPWPKWLPEIDSLVVRRQDSSTASSQTATQTATAEASASTSTDAADQTNLNTAGVTSTASDSSSGTADASATGTSSGTSSDKDSSSKTTSGSKSSSSNSTSVDIAASAVMKTPASTALTSALYKITDWVTFAWNYTNLEHTPTGVDVVISASTNSIASTWTLTSNMSFATDATFLWDTGAFQSQAVKNQQPLVVEMYTLYIYDSESQITATAGAGSLTANAAATFGLYTGQPYTALASGWVCGTCSAAMSDNDKRALGFMFTMVGVTVLSFTWFVTGLW